MVKRYGSMDEVPAELRRKLARYVTNVGGRTFAITGLPPELTGAVLARYSRTSSGMQLTLLNEFLGEDGGPSQELGSALINRVLNDFGDDSVGELEPAHVGVEGVSILLTKGIEDRRIGGSPIEESTRYVRFDKRDSGGRWKYLRPVEIVEAGLGEKFEMVNDSAFELYSAAIPPLMDHFMREVPREFFQIEVQRGDQKVRVFESDLVNSRESNQFDYAYRFTIRCAALDVARGMLPASTVTDLGLHGNGRFYTNLLSFLKSNELGEFNERGKELEVELNKVIPTFIKRNRANPRFAEIDKNMLRVAHELFDGMISEAKEGSLFVPRPESYLDETVAYSLFPYTDLSFPQILGIVGKLPTDKKQEINRTYKGARENRRDRTGRGLEAGYPLTFELVGTFGEYRDLERHRILTQQRQGLTTRLGFPIASEIEGIGKVSELEELVHNIEDLNSDIRYAGLELASQYATLLGHRIRFMFGMNLRELQHLAELRTQPAGHFGYRKIVMEMASQVIGNYPWATDFLEFVDFSDPGNRIARAEEQGRIAGKNLVSGLQAGLDYD